MRMAMTLGLLATAATLGGCGDGTANARGARVEHYALHSALARRTLRQTVVTPPGRSGRGRPLLVLLHGRGGSENSELDDPFFAALRGLGDRAPDLLFPSGGDHSYWHDRGDGAWGSSVVREAIPTAVRRLHADGRRVAIGGFSMGGFGAFDLARLHPGRFCAVGGHSAALWTSAGQTAPGAFDDAADYARHDVIAAARHHRHAFGRAAHWLDVGTQDPFRGADTTFATALRRSGYGVRFTVWPGQHGGDYWRSHYRAYLDFYARALTSCRPRG